MIFPVIFAALYLSHWTLLRLPYYWDEAGYYIPAAWDFFRTGSLIPITTISNAHPPLPSIYLALWWRSLRLLPRGHPRSRPGRRRHRPARRLEARLRLNPSPLVAFWTLLLTALYPIWFAQSTLAHADIFAAAATLWALVYALPDNARKPGASPAASLWPAALWFTVAALAKETSIVTPIALAAFELTAGFRKDPPHPPPQLPARRRVLRFCLVPLAAWYAYHYAKTGFLFGNPEFLRYNATSTLAPAAHPRRLRPPAPASLRAT
jgi:hypothetical protein